MTEAVKKVKPKVTEKSKKICLENVAKIYKTREGKIVALDQVSLEVKEQEFVSIVGPSGCGKSTVLRLLAGLEDASAGRVIVSGKEVTEPGADRGMVFQSYTLFPWLTVRENIEFGLKLKKMEADKRKKISDRYLELVSLEPFANALPKELSGGMKQRVAIARALANNPDVLLMDEPFGALDAQTKSEMQKLLVDIWKREKTTIVFITHDIDEAIFLSQRIYVMKARPGRIVEEMDVDLNIFQDGELIKSDLFIRIKKDIVSILKN